MLVVAFGGRFGNHPRGVARSGYRTRGGRLSTDCPQGAEAPIEVSDCKQGEGIGEVLVEEDAGAAEGSRITHPSTRTHSLLQMVSSSSTSIALLHRFSRVH